MKFTQFTCSCPEDWQEAFRNAATEQQQPLSFWLGKLCDNSLPATKLKTLYEWNEPRRATGPAKARKADSNNTPRFNMSFPADRRPHWKHAAVTAGYNSLSEWICETGYANLPPEIQNTLSERQSPGRPSP